MYNESTSYLVLFCALLLAEKNSATLQEAVAHAPLDGNASLLAAELLRQQAVMQPAFSHYTRSV